MTSTLTTQWKSTFKKMPSDDVPGIPKKETPEYSALKRAYDTMQILGKKNLKGLCKHEVAAHLDAYRVAKEHYIEMHRIYQEIMDKV